MKKAVVRIIIITGICLILLLSWIASVEKSHTPTPNTQNLIPENTPTPISEPQPNSNGAMARANLHGTGVYNTNGLQQFGGVKWQFKTNYGSVNTEPVIVDGTVYIGADDGYLYAVDAQTGQQEWEFKGEDMALSSPAVASGIVYFGGPYVFYALDSKTGNEKWKLEIKGKYRYVDFSSPAVAGGTVYVGSTNAFYALDGATGQEKWSVKIDGNVPASPVVANGLVYFGSYDPGGRARTYLFALDSITGQETWRFPTRMGTVSSPALSDGVLYVVDGEVGLYALDAMTGRRIWEYDSSLGFITSPAVAYGTVYVTDDGNLYAVDSATGQEKWKFHTEGTFIMSPVIAEGIVYLLSTKFTSLLPGIIATTKECFVYAIDAKTGQARWTHSMGEMRGYDPAINDGIVYFGVGGGYLYAIH